MSKKDTKTMQNTLNRLIDECELQVDDPYIKMKNQYFRAVQTLRLASHEFDILNDMIEEYDS